MSRSPLVIGLTGPLGSGVTTVSLALKEKGFQRISLSDAIKDELRKKEGIEGQLPFGEKSCRDFRKKLQDLGNAGRARVPHQWAESALSGYDGKQELVIDGIRNLEEINYLRERFAPQFFVIGLHASFTTRWDRSRDAYDGNQKNFERDDSRDAEEDLKTGQQVTKCVQQADYILLNDGNDHSLPDQKNKIYGELREDIGLMKEAGKLTAC
jgi:dephospho-CoA kinase